MAYISEAKHNLLIWQLESLIRKMLESGNDSQEQSSLDADRKLMEDIFNDYKKSLDELHELILQYQKVHQRARVALRKQQLAAQANGVKLNAGS